MRATHENVADTAASQALIAPLAAAYPGLSATVFRGDEIVWSFEGGYADLEQKLQVMSRTKFNIYSTTKALTGLAFARLEQRGRISREQSAGEIAPDLPTHLQPIEIEHILSHSSGVRHYTSPADWLEFAKLRCNSPRDALAYFADDPLEFEPGKQELYSTFAFVLASVLLVDATGGRDFATSLNTALGPWANFSLDTDDPLKAQGYMPAGLLPDRPESVSPEAIVRVPGLSAACKFGGGGVIASSAELARAGSALYRGEIVPTESLESGFRPWAPAFNTVFGGAVGTIRGQKGPIHTYSLSGGAPGGRSYLLIMIEPRISVAIAGNFDGQSMEDEAWALGRLWSEMGEAGD